MSTPSPRQVFGCKVRAAREAYEHQHRNPLGGGWELPSREETYAYLAAEFGPTTEFGLSTHELSLFFTYSRACTHPWSAGACSKCPE